MIPLRTSHVVFYAAIVTLTVTAVVGWGFWNIRRQMLTGNDFLLDAESKEIMARIAQIIPPVDARKLEEALREHTKVDEELFYFQVNDANSGRIIYHSPNLGSGELPSMTGRDAKVTLKLSALGRVREAVYVTPSVRVQIAMSLRNFETVNDYFLRLMLVGVPLIAALSLSFSMALRRSTLRPMKLMQDTAMRINASNLNQRIPVPSGHGEMVELAKLLNQMFDRLERSFSEVKRFTANTSHEIMTPLSVIRLHSERMLNDPQLPAKHRHSADEILQEALHLAQILERLMVLTKADSTILPLDLKPWLTSEFLNQFGEDAQLLAESRGLGLVVANLEDRTVFFDSGWIRQVLFNLLSNALRFSPPGGTITLRSDFDDERWSVEVMDEGQGVPEERLQDIFERFVQIEPRSEPNSGSGLGLAICKSIVSLHKGQIWARNRKDRTGLAITFTLPLRTANTETIPAKGESDSVQMPVPTEASHERGWA